VLDAHYRKTPTCLTLPSPARPDHILRAGGTPRLAADGTGSVSDLLRVGRCGGVCRLEELGLAVTGQRLEPDWAVLACRLLDPDPWCRR